MSSKAGGSAPTAGDTGSMSVDVRSFGAESIMLFAIVDAVLQGLRHITLTDNHQAWGTKTAGVMLSLAEGNDGKV